MILNDNCPIEIMGIKIYGWGCIGCSLAARIVDWSLAVRIGCSPVVAGFGRGYIARRIAVAHIAAGHTGVVARTVVVVHIAVAVRTRFAVDRSYNAEIGGSV
jgi:hypothetical protein